MNPIALSISKSIKEGKWLSIYYTNKEGDNTSYWCAIHDIIIEKKSFKAKTFNLAKITNEQEGIISDAFLRFEGINRADVIDHTTYEVPSKLITKIYTHLEDLEWLQFDLYNEKVLNYLKECIKYDSTPYQSETALVQGIDVEAINKAKLPNRIELSPRQRADLAESLEKIAKQDKERSYRITELAINLLSIHTRQGLFVCAYKKLLYDPSEHSLIMGNDTLYNYDFAADENESFKHNLRNYLDIETDAFAELFSTHPEKAKNMLMKPVSRFGESIDDRPYIMDLVRNYQGYIEKEFLSITLSRKDNTLSVPLKAFFGNMETSLLSRKRNFDIVLIDDMMNIDQLRAIHNALKNPITYVQGPPGTGKTQSILNILISAFFNQQTVLVSSNNNKPIDDIYAKLNKLKSKGRHLPLPILRLGNNEKVKESIKIIKDFIERADKLNTDDDKLSRHRSRNQNDMKGINHIIDQYERRLELLEEIDALESMKKSLLDDFRVNLIIEAELTSKNNELSSITVYQDEDIHKLVSKADESFLTWLFFTSIKHIKKLQEPKYESFLNILKDSNEEHQVRDFNAYLMDDDNFNKILKVFPIIMTTNQSAHRLGAPTSNFDLVIIDEAGQCSIGASIFPIIRGKRLLLVGDQNQLRPVITMSPEVNKRLMKKHQISQTYNYVDNSIIRLMQSVDSISKFILLRYHYRCHKDIIDFSNRKYYRKKLIIPEKQGFDQQALFYLDVKTPKTFRSNDRNTSIAEVEAIIEDIKNKDNQSIGIITPFRNQANLIKEKILSEGLTQVDVGTVHTFQGDEKDCIYLSSAITHSSSNKTYDWIKNNQELINVATTRAKKEFVFVGDLNEIKAKSSQGNDYFELLQYVKNNGKEVHLTEVVGDHYVNSANYKQYNTAKEKELLESVKHILSSNAKYTIAQQVKVSTILNRFQNKKLHDYGTKSVFDFVIYEKIQNDLFPRLVIELDGEEHSIDQKTISRDALKESICKENNIILQRIPNNYTRRYVFIKEIIKRLLM